MTRFAPSRMYLIAASVSLGLAAFSGWCALSWLPAWIAAGLFAISGLGLLLLAFRPVIEIGDTALRVGDRRIEWETIARVDRTGWISPLVVDITLTDGSRCTLVYPGEVHDSNRLFHLLQQRSHLAIVDGVPPVSPVPVAPAAPAAAVARTERKAPRYRLLTEEDEAEVERLYQKLRTAGRLDPEK